MSRNQPVRVLHTIGRLIPGGVELRTLELIKQTSEENIQHHICVVSGQSGTLDDEFRAAGAHVHYLNIHSPLYAPRFLRLLRRELIDVIHSTLMYASGYLLMLAYMAGTNRRIVQFRSDGNNEMIGLFTHAKRHLLRFLIDKSATHIVGLTPANLEVTWSKNWRQDPRCSIVTNGVAAGREPLTQANDIPAMSSQNIVIHAGRGELATKNREKAITAFAEYARYRSESILVFVGRDGLDQNSAAKNRAAWKQLARQFKVSDRVFFLGQRESVLPYFSTADLLLFTSTLEGLPGVILEALSVGLPVLSSNVPGALFIADSNTNVSILDPKEPDKHWAASMLQYDSKLSPSARKKNIDIFAKSMFNIERSSQKYLKLWEAR